MLKTKALLFSIISWFTLADAFAQGQGNTPYSVYGFGELADQTAASQEMMGGTGASFSNAFYFNRINPALLVKNRVASGLKYVSFNVGFRGNSRTITTTNSAQKDFGLNLNHLSLTTPITANWAMGVVMSPYSMLDNTTEYTQPIVGSTNESITHLNTSSGGITRISYVNSFRLFDKLYLGLEANSNFGSIQKDSSTYLFNNISNQLRTNTRYVIKGVGLKGGLAYQHKINDKWRANIGGSVEFSSHLKVEELRTYGVYADIGNGAFLTQKPDTLSLRNTKAQTPPQYRIGLSLESPFHWVFAADYHTTRWSDSKNLDAQSQKILKNTEEIRFGIEYLPNSSSTNYFNQIFYRVGFANIKTPYYLNSTRITDNRISLGVSVPMGFRNPSYMNFGVALGKRGVTANNLVQENYLQFSISTSLLSPWFIKPKID